MKNQFFIVVLLYFLISIFALYCTVGTPSEQVQDDGKVSFEEFKMLATKGDELHLKTSALWASVRQVQLLWRVSVRVAYCECSVR